MAVPSAREGARQNSEWIDPTLSCAGMPKYKERIENRMTDIAKVKSKAGKKTHQPLRKAEEGLAMLKHRRMFAKTPDNRFNALRHKRSQLQGHPSALGGKLSDGARGWSGTT